MRPKQSTSLQIASPRYARLAMTIRAAQRKRRKLFCAFLTLGYPNLRATEELIKGFEKKGADLVELGFPFSDPLADGPTIQFSSEAALKKGVALEDAFHLVKRLRKQGVQIPIIFFSYLNPICHYGEDRFPSRLKAAGFDGLIVPDCPPEEEHELWQACRRAGIASVFLLSPTTVPDRARKIFASSHSFLYYVSLRGVTGARRSLARDLGANLKRFHRLGRKPLLVGFGVSNSEQVKRVSRVGDGVIVGSAIVDQIRKSKGKTAPVLSFVGSLIHSLNPSQKR